MQVKEGSKFPKLLLFRALLQARQGTKSDNGWDRPCWSSQSLSLFRNKVLRRKYALKKLFIKISL
jgi:hypothetical protein